MPSTRSKSAATKPSAEAFARLFESVHEGVYIGTVNGASSQTLAANPHLKVMFGYSTDASECEVEPFAVEGSRPTTVEVAFDTNLSNNWTYFNVALVNLDTGSALDFGKEVSYYFGRDSDGNWTEGSRRGVVRVPSVDPGSYYLRVETETDARSRTAEASFRPRARTRRPHARRGCRPRGAGSRRRRPRAASIRRGKTSSRRASRAPSRSCPAIRAGSLERA